MALRRAGDDSAQRAWVRYFLTSSLGDNVECARRLGANVQVHAHTVEGLGQLAVLADAAGCYFGLYEPRKAATDA